MKPRLLARLVKLHEKNQYYEIVETIQDIPAENWDYELVNHLARAYNNLENYESAVQLLLSVAAEGCEDPLWHYRLGYSYYYLDQLEESKSEFEEVLKLNPDDEDAQNFLSHCQKELAIQTHLQRTAERAIPYSELTFEKSFTARVDEFWQWFSENEEKLADIVTNTNNYDRDDIVEFIAEGTNLLAEDVHFNIGGEFEFTFAVDDDNYLFYLYPYIIARMPLRFRDKWHFSPYLSGAKGKGFTFEMHGARINLDEVKVFADYDADSGKFTLYFYDDTLCSLEDAEAHNIFHLLVELSIGEALANVYVAEVERLESPRQDMYSLTDLDDKIRETITASGEDLINDPSELYVAYEFDPIDSEIPRHDIITGVTHYLDLINDYYFDTYTNADGLEKYGAKPVFLFFPTYMEADYGLVDLRYDLEELIENKIIGTKGSGEELGLLLGGATGIIYSYIDLLLYDEAKFLAKFKEILVLYPYTFYFAEFRQQGKLVKLTGEI